MARDRVRERLRGAGFTEVMADVNLEYGGWFGRETDKGQFDMIEIVDLDSAAGADGCVLVSAYRTAFEFAHGYMDRVIATMDVRQWLPSIAHHDKPLARLSLAQAIASYGLVDPVGGGISSFVARLEIPSWCKVGTWWQYLVNGYGTAAFLRAVDNAIACCDNGGYWLPHEVGNDS